MYSNTAYLYQTDLAVEDLSRPLIVESCGTYRLKTLPVMNTSRQAGRKDYQLLYLHNGKASFTFPSGKEFIPSGHMIFYPPGVPQQYTYYAEDRPEVFWIHFTGKDVPDILGQLGLFADGPVIYTGVSSEYTGLFLQIIREMQSRRSGFEEISALLLYELFLRIRRTLSERALNQNNQMQKEMEEAVHFFHENSHKHISINEYAASRHMSVCWFIRSFKEYTGMAPIQYLTSIRMADARGLLESSDYSIGEIAVLVGYDNPLYFSRIFRKYNGCPPSVYRERRGSR